MNCERIRELLGAHLDRELDAVNDLELQEHLRGCPRCLHAAEQGQQMQRLVRAGAPYYRASRGLEARITASLGKKRVRADGGARNKAFSSFTWRRVWPGAVGLAAAVLLAVGIMAVMKARLEAGFLSGELVSAHVRSLMGEHLTDVVSSDQHTVKPWFAGKVDFAPPVHDLSAEGFPLIGGRAEHIAGHPAAALVFQRNKHIINLFIWAVADGPGLSDPLLTVRGYNLISWRRQDLAFCAVSDLNYAELRLFGELYQGK